MGQGHRDNHAARVKRGPVAFEKKAERRGPAGPNDKVKCNLCGTPTRPSKIEAGICPMCLSGQR